MTDDEKKLRSQKRWYMFAFVVLWPIALIFFPHRYYGRENIPEGPAIICPPHSSLLDPLFVSLAMGHRFFVHHMAKAELLRVPLVRWIMRKAGTIFVRRGESDIEAFKKCIKALKEGEKLMIFPEGTRVRGDDHVDPKPGAVRLAANQQVPIVPVYLPRDKKVFHHMDVVFGEPYMIPKSRDADYEALSRDLMERIWQLGRKNNG